MDEVKIVSIDPCILPLGYPLKLITGREGGPPRCEDLSIEVPAVYETIVTAIVSGTTQMPDMTVSAEWGIRDLARMARMKARSWAKPLRLDVPFLDLRNLEPNNISHLLCDIVPLFLHARKRCGTGLKLILRQFDPVHEGRYRAFLSEFGIDPIVTTARVSGPRVKIMASRAKSHHQIETTFDCLMLPFFPETFRDFKIEPAQNYEKVFISRRGARALLNEEEVAHFLATRGYRTVFFEDLQPREQLAIAAAAVDVVAIHGAAMALLATSKKLRKVLEIQPPHVYHDTFRTATPAVPNYCIVTPSLDTRAHTVGWSMLKGLKNEAFALDLGLLEYALDALSDGAEVPGAAA
jgi:hypothetical protein